ncbi:MAG: primosomal protein N', partial [Acidimicrobiales bacterium]
SHDEASSLCVRLRAMNQAVALMPGQWPQARAGGYVVVGSRAAAWAPVSRLGAVLVLDAHDQAYVEERAPTWNAWTVVTERARRAGVSCVLASPCPSLEMLDRAALSTSSRAEERQGWPVVEVIDRKSDDPRLGLFSDRLVDLVRSARPEPGHRVLCVLNRKGRARLLACAHCGELTRCERCHAALASMPTAAAPPAPTSVLVCRRCGLERPEVCASCGSTRLKVLRAGVSRVRAELEALVSFPVADVAAGKAAAPASPGDWEGAEAAVIVGTEAVLHRVARAEVGSVAFLDFDQELLAPRFRAGETALALLARAGRLVGRRSDGGRVLVQTRIPDHEVLEAAARADPGRFRVAELATRQILGLPPARVLAIVTGDGAASFASGLAEFALEVSDVSTPGVGGRDGDVERGRWLVRAQDHHQLCSALAELDRPRRGLRIEVDPVRV